MTAEEARSRIVVPHRIHEILRTPFGRLLATKDRGVSLQEARMFFQSRLDAEVTRGEISRRLGLKTERLDLGSGLVTNVGVLAMSNDPAWSAQLNLATLALQNWVATGTGVTAAAATDFRLQTLAAPTTANAVSGAQSIVAPLTFVGPTAPIFKQITTINYVSTLAITEWGLHSLQSLSSATGSPFTAATATTWTDTGSVQTASSATVRGLQQTIVLPGTTAVLGLNGSNTTHVGTLLASVTPTGWYTQSTQAAGSTPGGTEAFAILPVMWDHKVFAAINVNSGDSIQFTYSLSINSGG